VSTKVRNRKLKSALRAARLGLNVLPLHWVKRGRCTCGKPACSSPGKHPRTPRGVYDATTDNGQIRRWWSDYPDANIGIATGSTSGVFAIDIDRRHGGFETLKKFQKKYGRLPTGPVSRTGGGGLHFFFACPDVPIRNKVGVLPGIDVRGEGGLVVGPGSVHPSGKRYLWKFGKSPRKVDFPQCPAPLLELISGLPYKDRQSVKGMITEGNRHSTFVSLAGVMRSRGVSGEAIEAALLEDNQQRCEPPLPEDEVCNIARSVSRYAPDGSGNCRGNPS